MEFWQRKRCNGGPTSWLMEGHISLTYNNLWFLQVARGGHRKGTLATHTCCAGDTWYVDLAEDEMRKTLGKTLGNLRISILIEPYRSSFFFFSSGVLWLYVSHISLK